MTCGRVVLVAVGLASVLAGPRLTAADSGPVGGERIDLIGTDLTGWIAVPATASDGTPIWSVRDGVIRCIGKPKGYLRTTSDYANFVLRVQWRWVGTPGNSGVFVQGSGPDKVWPRCYEAQLQAGNAGELRANGGAKFHEESKPEDRSLPKRAPSSEREPGAWNDYRIICRGDEVELSVNGILQNRLDRAALTSGWIALQSEGGVIEFRALTLERLPP